MNLKDKYNHIFKISDPDYNKAKYYYDTYLKIFDEILKDNKSFNENDMYPESWTHVMN